MGTETRPIRIGADIGGTFTDLEIFNTRERRITSHKVPTTPEDPSIGLMIGLKDAGERFGEEFRGGHGAHATRGP